MTPILFGSAAAHMHGHLPPWREGKWNDIDLLTPQEWEAPNALMYRRKSETLAVSSWLFEGRELFVDNVINAELYNEALELTTEEVQSVAGDTLLLGSMELVWAIRHITTDLLGRSFEQAQRDDEYYSSVVVNPSEKALIFAQKWGLAERAITRYPRTEREGPITEADLTPAQLQKAQRSLAAKKKKLYKQLGLTPEGNSPWPTAVSGL